MIGARERIFQSGNFPENSTHFIEFLNVYADVSFGFISHQTKDKISNSHRPMKSVNFELRANFFTAEDHSKSRSLIQGVRGISAIILTDDYLCHKEPKSPYNFLFYFNI